MRQTTQDGRHANYEQKHSKVKDTYFVHLSAIVSGNSFDNVIEHTGYALAYNREFLTPYWVAWELTSEETSGPISRKDYDFIPDPALEEQYQVDKAEYTNSGYDRGHMCPAGDMEWSSSAMHDCHYMTNICPQAPKLNQVYWERLESACRRWANMYGSIYVVCGPVYKSEKNETIGINHLIAIPDGFFKVVVMLKEGEEKGIGFYYVNDDVHQTMEEASMSIDEIENITGYDFFHELPDELEETIESQNNLNKWK